MDHDTTRPLSPGWRTLNSGAFQAPACVLWYVDSNVPIAYVDVVVGCIDRNPVSDVSCIAAVSQPSDGNHTNDDTDDDGDDCISSQSVRYWGPALTKHHCFRWHDRAVWEMSVTDAKDGVNDDLVVLLGCPAPAMDHCFRSAGAMFLIMPRRAEQGTTSGWRSVNGKPWQGT